MRRLAPLFAARFLGLSALPASALTAVFDFDDFPYSPGNDDDVNPYTYLYGCDGKNYCTGRDIAWANDVSDGGLQKVSTTRNGIFMELGGREMLINYELDGDIIHGNDSYDYDLFLLDFDTALQSFSARFSSPQVVDQYCDDDGNGNDVCTDIYELLKVYLWSEAGGQGELVGSLVVTPYDLVPPGILTLSLVSDAPFRSVNIGKAISLEPDCITGGCGFPGGPGGPSFTFDDIVVSTVPEPSPALLVGVGLIAMAAARRVRRLAPLLAVALGLALSPHPASAVSALFDFDDFPGGVGPRDPLWNAPYTYLYRCDGKDYCTGQEALNASTGGGSTPRKIATTRNGIAMEFSRAGGGYTINYDGAGALDDGDDSWDSFALFLFDFDTPLQSFEGRISAPSVISEICDENDVCTDIYSLVELYLWSDPGGQGTLVGSLALTHDDVLGSGSAVVSLTTDQPFRSANFGHGRSGDPDSWDSTPYNDFGIGYILVSTVPEPTTAALLALGLTGIAAARRLRAAV